jgi:myo-inositol-1(or 4)-monophosphatase
MAHDDMHGRFLALAAIAREAGVLARRYYEDPQLRAIDYKGPQDHTTAADGAVEALIKERIAAVFPDDAVFGEEGGGRFGERVWVIDPIDGTANFGRGIAHWGVSIAYVEAGTIELGAIYAPITDELFLARRGAGATLNGRAMRVSAQTDIGRASVACGWSARRPMADYLRVVERVNAAGAVFRRAGSGALGIAYVADGRAEAYCELHINAWDCLAGIVMVTEAGGWANDFLAGDGLTKGNALLCCCPALKDTLIDLTGIGR